MQGSLYQNKVNTLSLTFIQGPGNYALNWVMPRTTVIKYYTVAAFVWNKVAILLLHDHIYTVLRNNFIKIDYFIESAPYGFLLTSRKTLETNE